MFSISPLLLVTFINVSAVRPKGSFKPYVDPRPVPYLAAEVDLIDADGCRNPIAKAVDIQRATTVQHNSGLICVPS